MEYDEFITHVQTLAQSDSREEAERATRAKLETLKERIASDEAQQLAANLPEKLGNFLRGGEGNSDRYFSLQEFIARASQKENIEPTITAIHVRAVFAVLQNAIDPEIFGAFHAHLSRDYEQLFAASPTG
ncbi:MAG: DUF2267 domain-containing protein [Nostoc sp. ChiSLP02]|nr:DUF2267 domain-containing protein [Nostoc sp. DedSLP05]MDZ8100781.1 DUF2267 domain-containing protein [Nostoc sp. DedSLP01]MDZ8188230.1 DUF2267 domain-containing protein [Nostoc sp. ChiSLP02]